MVPDWVSRRCEERGGGRGQSFPESASEAGVGTVRDRPLNIWPAPQISKIHISLTGKSKISRSRDFIYIGRLRPFLSLDDLEFNVVAFLQALISITGNGAVVDEYIRSRVASQEAVPFRVIEPLHRSLYAFHGSLSLLLKPKNRRRIRGLSPNSALLWNSGLALSRK